MKNKIENTHIDREKINTKDEQFKLFNALTKENVLDLISIFDNHLTGISNMSMDVYCDFNYLEQFLKEHPAIDTLNIRMPIDRFSKVLALNTIKFINIDSPCTIARSQFSADEINSLKKNTNLQEIIFLENFGDSDQSLLFQNMKEIKRNLIWNRINHKTERYLDKQIILMMALKELGCNLHYILPEIHVIILEYLNKLNINYRETFFSELQKNKIEEKVSSDFSNNRIETIKQIFELKKYWIPTFCFALSPSLIKMEEIVYDYSKPSEVKLSLLGQVISNCELEFIHVDKLSENFPVKFFKSYVGDSMDKPLEFIRILSYTLYSTDSQTLKEFRDELIKAKNLDLKSQSEEKCTLQ